MKKKDQGITLISLVVTIIILLILAGVTLSLITGSEGILGRATNAVDEHEITTIQETVELKIAEDIERFHEEKYVNFSIDNAMTAYEYLKENTDKTIKKGDEEYTITYTDSTNANNLDDNKIQVSYTKKGTKLNITGEISLKAVITWDKDVENLGGDSGGSGTGGSEQDIPLSISKSTWNGTNVTVTLTGKKKGSTLQYKIGDTGEWKDIKSGESITIPVGTTFEVCFFDGTEREIISETPTLIYTVAYDGNGATNGKMKDDLHQYGTEKALSKNGFIKEGYTFKAWNTNLDGTGTSYTDEQNVINLSDTNEAIVRLYAQWEEDKKATEVIKATSYGEPVDYSANGIEDWKIFYNDGTNIYIITGGYAPNTGLNCATGLKLYRKFAVYGPEKTWTRDEFLNWLSDSTYWTAYANGTSGGLEIEGAVATGGPTIEQFWASYNEKYGTDFSGKKNFQPADSGYNDKLYCRYDIGMGTCAGYRLTSANPSERNDTYVVTYNHCLSSYTYYWQQDGVRPLVCLPKNIKVTKGDDGKWIFSN